MAMTFAVCAAIGALTVIAFIGLLALALLDRMRNTARREQEGVIIADTVKDVERWLAEQTETDR